MLYLMAACYSIYGLSVVLHIVSSDLCLQINEILIWSFYRRVLTEEEKSTQKETSFTVTLSTTYPTSADLVSKNVTGGRMPASSRLGSGTA